MRKTTSSALGIACLLLACAAPAAADEVGDKVVALDANNKLVQLLAAAENPDATWQERWKAYKAATKAMGKVSDPYKEGVEAAYKEMRPVVAVSLRRDELPIGGWIMGIIAALILWGGFAVHVRIAAKHGAKPEKPGEDEAWPPRPQDAS